MDDRRPVCGHSDDPGVEIPHEAGQAGGLHTGAAFLPLVARSIGWFLVSAVATTSTAWGAAAIDLGNQAVQNLKSARADSTGVGETLQRIANERWQSDAVLFGHGTVQPCAHLVEYMPIGSHHTWYGLLFVNGITGFVAFLVPFAFHFGVVITDAVRSACGRLPVGLLLLTFGENTEIEAYLLWPALLILGCHLREMAGTRAQPSA